MEKKIGLKEEQLAQVSGGTGETNGRKCPQCGSTKVKFKNEVGDAGKFVCEDCGCEFYGDI